MIQPTGPADVSSYNQQIMQLWAPIIQGLVSLLGFFGLWLKSNWDKKELKDAAAAEAADVKGVAEETAKAMATKTKETAEVLAAKTEGSAVRVMEKIEESHQINAVALDKANHTNEKILALQQQAMEDRAAAASHPLGPVEVKVVAGPGVETPLIVKQEEP
ncbi:MAG TPA: hypothetical protein VFS77_22200 [Pyrinomonadaceae bacterium]|nr:hypothetical protein [Pyrinomonadaceae bacterium]